MPALLAADAWGRYGRKAAHAGKISPLTRFDMRKTGGERRFALPLQSQGHSAQEAGTRRIGI
ncbi:hypothetical protein ACLEIY_04755 [Acetobacter tropicalis]|uniref:hypothetical protein n=1 Tax=Acetobacter tropicalis TaxID=104102 RepID=UPI003974F684